VLIIPISSRQSGSWMLALGRLVSLAVSAGLLAAALTGCGRGGSAVPVSAVYVSQAVPSTVIAASSMHVTGRYDWPGSTLAVSTGLLASGQLSGQIVDDGAPMTVVDTGGRMYAEFTAGFLAFYRKSAECAALCGKYLQARPSLADGLIASIGVAATRDILVGMAQSASTVTAVTYGGRPALRAAVAGPGYARGAYLIVSATADCLPLKADNPGHYVLTFSRWNKVPAPALPAAAQIYAGAW
jgi:hypothetical protein